METIKKVLGNGVTVLCSEAKVPEVSLTIKSGHINETKVGVAAVYENIVAQNANNFNLMSICGGSLTSFVTGAKGSITVALKYLYDNCVSTAVTKRAVNYAVEDISKHTRDMAPLPVRQTKLAYKHTAFSHNQVFWQPERYIDKLKALTVCDVKNYITDNYVGRNVVISYSGLKKYFDTVFEVAEKYFGLLPVGERKNICLEYTGGFSFIKGNGSKQLAFFGWELPASYNTAETNVMMSMLSGRLERSLAEAGLVAEAVVKIAGYFGLRTLRIAVSCDADSVPAENGKKRNVLQECIDVVSKNVKRLQTSIASDRRMETSRQRAMAERLGISNEALPRSVEVAWSLLGRNIDYDNDKAITNIWEVTAQDVRSTAQDIFSTKMTCVIYSSEPSSSFDVKALSVTTD